ncbi:butyrophilin subfamily 3 member A1-like [Mauremys reevesii]|uniref:butyrophilin subfamily 3 member A1-like n=1 Tax=Mauremys reevesii TaxID=260615 RepID=UPI00193ED07E|nr:butyrophilin subfamily 3 member A1-like [Mauremys reevesii]
MELREQLSICLFCAILLAAIPFSENFEVISSPTVTGIVGQDVVLPCQISTGTQPDNMEVQWKKIIQAAIETVYEYKAQTGQDGPGEKYQGRTVLLKDGFTSGNVSLKLKNVRPANEGTYSCIVKSNEWSADAATELKIAAVASVSIDVLGPQGQGIDLACRSTGWFPKPEVRWVINNGSDLQPVTKMEQDHELLFSILSNVTILGQETGEISCVIQNNLLKTEKKSVILLSGDIFPHVSPWLAAFWVLFTLNLLVIGACAFWIYTVKQKESTKKKSEEEALFIQDTAKKALEQEHQELQERLGRAISELDFRRARSYMVPLTLDPSCKHPELTLSADGRTVQHKPTSQDPAVSSGALIAVGREGFVTRRNHFGEGEVCRWYWEVKVEDSPDWELGVLSETVRDSVKQERLKRPPEGECWALRRSGGWYQPREANIVIQSWGVKPKVVGVYLDLEAGNLSFYSVSGMAIILEISVEGSERLFPFLSPGHAAGREEGEPLSICLPSDWDFSQKFGTSSGDNTASAQSPASRDGKGAGDNTGSSALGETSLASGHCPASGDGDEKEISTEFSVREDAPKHQTIDQLPKKKEDKTDQEHTQLETHSKAEAGKEKPEAIGKKIQNFFQRGKDSHKEKNAQNVNPGGTCITGSLVSGIPGPGDITGESDPTTATLGTTLPERKSGEMETLKELPPP